MFSIPCLRFGLRHPLTRKIPGSLGSQRDFTVLCRVKTHEVVPPKYGFRLAHGKGETEALSFLLLRWTKLAWSNMFGKYLIVTNVVGSGLLMVVGDAIAQEYEYRRGLRHQDRFDTDRMYRMFVAGALQGPLHHFVYNWMDRIMPARTLQNILKKILIDQLFMSPACIFIFFYSICYLERQTLEATNKELISKFPYVYLLDWMTWPAAQYLNFRYLDTKYRVTFVNVCTAVYNVLMSYMKHDFGIHLPLEGEVVESSEVSHVAPNPPNSPEAQKSA
ncbi:mpv17-like protein 2 [Drosophila rhopaloa]|uniref:Mpv17-like protein 2 n=1 Tax=Drosophila rhopaloa TaxID=1041015 RepID=A0ABM5HEH4_DRORH|nr:mpv17-like protein 2 [Drosophila rhopaloa]